MVLLHLAPNIFRFDATFKQAAKSMYNGLERQKQLKLRKIFQATAAKTNDLADEYSEIFPLKDDLYVKCLENPENCRLSVNRSLTRPSTMRIRRPMGHGV